MHQQSLEIMRVERGTEGEGCVKEETFLQVMQIIGTLFEVLQNGIHSLPPPLLCMLAVSNSQRNRFLSKFFRCFLGTVVRMRVTIQ